MERIISCNIMKKKKYIKGIFFGKLRDYKVSFPEDVTFESFKSAYECHNGDLEKEYERLTGRKANGSPDKITEKSGKSDSKLSGSGKSGDKGK